MNVRLRSGGGSSGHSHSPLVMEVNNEDDDPEFEEKDPTGRYGRYKEVLGKGAFKTVYKAFDELEGMEVAWNQVKVHDVTKRQEDIGRLFSEIHLLQTLKHQNIIKFYSSWVDAENDNINFITEIFTSGTLRQYRQKHKHVDMRALKNWSRQILRGLLYLHSHDPPIIHRDLKCDNIFVNGNQGQVKIGDLGLAAILKQTRAAHSVIGTPEFMAPELYEEDYNELVDIYSFGMCLLEMITFEYPYSECENAAQIFKRVSKGIKPAALEKVKDPEVREFVEKCLASVSRRLPAKQLLMDPFLQSDGTDNRFDQIPCQIQYPRQHMTTPTDELSSGNSTSLEEDERLEIQPNANVRPMPRSSSTARDNDQHMESYSESESNPWDRNNRDFTVKGQKTNENRVFLTLRMMDTEGAVRNIHFPFDVVLDTAISVANEMVTELHLSEQDVSNIAAMIDAEIQALVPDWQPTVPLDDDFTHEDLSGRYDVSALADDVNELLNISDRPQNGLVLERFPSGRHFWSDSPKVLPRATSASSSKQSRLRPTRSEEIKCEFLVSNNDNGKHHLEESEDHESNKSGLFADAEDRMAIERTGIHGNIWSYNQRKSLSCSEFERLSYIHSSTEGIESDNDFQEDFERLGKESSSLDVLKPHDCLEEPVPSSKKNNGVHPTFSTEIVNHENLSISRGAEIESIVVGHFQNLVLKQQQEMEELRKKHMKNVEVFLDQLLKKGFSIQVLKKLLPSPTHTKLDELHKRSKQSDDVVSKQMKLDKSNIGTSNRDTCMSISRIKSSPNLAGCSISSSKNGSMGAHTFENGRE